MHDTQTREAVVNGLAAFGFLSLVGIGIALVIYATPSFPTLMNRLGGAAVYLSSVFTPSDDSGLTVVPNATTTPSGSTATTTATSTKPGTGGVTPGQQTNGVYPIGGGGFTGDLRGLPDLTVSIKEVGFLSSTSTDSFVASSTTQGAGRPAVRFVIKNEGTNVTGSWMFTAKLPTQSNYAFGSQMQKALYPGESIEYTLGFDQASSGDQAITIIADSTQIVAESSESNNSASALIRLP